VARVREEGEEKKVALRSRIEYQAEVAKLLLFNREAEQVVDFVTVCKFYIRMRMRDMKIKEQVQ